MNKSKSIKLLKKCEEKIFPIYTKSFGGKIWKNLHSVSPGNIFDKKFKMASLKSFPPKIFEHHLMQKNENKHQFLCMTEKKHRRFF